MIPQTLSSKAVLLAAAASVVSVGGYLTWGAVTGASSTANGTSITSGSTSGALSGSGSSTTGTTTGAGSASNKGVGNDNKTFTISGAVSGLYPKVADKQLTLTLRNNGKKAIIVRSITVTVATAPSGCDKSNIRIGSAPSASPSRTFTTSVGVGPNGTGTYSLPISMAAGAPNECAGASFGFSYSGGADAA